MGKLRVVHFINQFFAGKGGEDKAGLELGVEEQAVGPGRLLQQIIREAGTVVATIYCGDNYLVENPETAKETILAYVSKYKPDVLIAGPAFNSGRYGIGCGEVCATVSEKLWLPCVTGMFRENPAVDIYRSKVYIVSTSSTTTGMNEAMTRMWGLAVKLAIGEKLGSAQEEGYFAKGLRYNQVALETVGVRTVNMLLKRLNGEEFQTEWPTPKYDRVTPAHPLKELKNATIAVITSGGIVPKGNRDHLESARASKWLKYDIGNLHVLTPDQWESIHGGYDTTNANDDPNRVLPLDAIRKLAQQQVFGQLFKYMYVTTGNQAGLDNARRFGREVAQDLLANKVDGVLFVAT
jgi:betaine reductase